MTTIFRGRWRWPLALVALAGTFAVAPATPPASAAQAALPRVELDFPVTAMDQTEGYSNNSPVIVADPTERRFVVMANRLDAPDFGCALQLSGDAGRTWEPARPVPKLPKGAEKCYAPEVAFDRKGLLHYLFVGLAGEGNEPTGAYLTTSADRGRTFSPPRRVLGPLNFAVRMAIDPTVGERGRIHLVWLHATSDPPLGAFGPPPNPIMAAYSDDGGDTFSKPVQVSDASRDRVVAPALALGPDRTVNVAYYDLGDDVRDYQGLEGPVWEGTWSIVLARSTDGGRTFSSGVVVDDQIAPPERVLLIFTMAPPSLAVAPSGRRMCVAWADARQGDGDAVLRCSSDGGRTWGALRRMNDDKVANGARQYLPRIALSPRGRLDAVFLDRRNDPNNVSHDVYFTWSTDGGASFAPNIRLTPRSSSSTVGQRYVGPAAAGQAEWGARLGLLAGDAVTIAAWPDARYSQPETTGQELRSTAIVFGPEEDDDGGGGGGAAVVAAGVVAAVVVLGGAALVAARRRRRGEQDGGGEGGGGGRDGGDGGVPAGDLEEPEPVGTAS